MENLNPIKTNQFKDLNPRHFSYVGAVLKSLQISHKESGNCFTVRDYRYPPWENNYSCLIYEDEIGDIRVFSALVKDDISFLGYINNPSRWDRVFWWATWEKKIKNFIKEYWVDFDSEMYSRQESNLFQTSGRELQ